MSKMIDELLTEIDSLREQIERLKVEREEMKRTYDKRVEDLEKDYVVVRDNLLKSERRIAELEAALNRYSEQEILGGTVLPCTIDRCNIETGEHDDGCPAYYRHLVGGALAAARIEGMRRAAKICLNNVWASQAKFDIDAEIAALECGKDEAK